jgi:ankyrin repeat protein
MTEAKDLLRAVMKSDLDEVKAMIEAGVDVNEQPMEGYAPLFQACLKSEWDIALELLKAGADPNRKVGESYPLPNGGFRSTEVTEACIKAGVDLELCDTLGHTALQNACESGNEASVLALLNAGANAKLVDSEGRTPLHSAVIKGKTMIEAIKALKSVCDLDVKDKFDQTALDIATVYNNLEVIEILA